MKRYIGIDIGGTKCRVNYGVYNDSKIEVIEIGKTYKTANFTPYDMLNILNNDILVFMEKNDINGIGISCGGPLDSRKGVILSPPNLPGWNEIEIVEFFKNSTKLPVWLCNDANACALCEWLFGAGKGSHHMMFLTFGTGMGAGLILEDRLYIGACDMAGEVGHIRLTNEGPVGYGKQGSFEGYCSGGGITQLAQTHILMEKQIGHQVSWENNPTSAKDVAIAASNNDPIAINIMKESAVKLGHALSLFIDLLNLDCIIIGSIYERNSDFFYPLIMQVIENETLCMNREVCEIRPSYFKDAIGDYASLCVAAYYGGEM